MKITILATLVAILFTTFPAFAADCPADPAPKVRTLCEQIIDIEHRLDAVSGVGADTVEATLKLRSQFFGLRAEGKTQAQAIEALTERLKSLEEAMLAKLCVAPKDSELQKACIALRREQVDAVRDDDVWGFMRGYYAPTGPVTLDSETVETFDGRGHRTGRNTRKYKPVSAGDGKTTLAPGAYRGGVERIERNAKTPDGLEIDTVIEFADQPPSMEHVPTWEEAEAERKRKVEAEQAQVRMSATTRWLASTGIGLGAGGLAATADVLGQMHRNRGASDKSINTGEVFGVAAGTALLTTVVIGLIWSAAD